MEALAIYLGAINLIAMSVMVFDKKRAIRRGRRVPEKTLFLLAAVGGSVGMLAAMRMWRHKTKHLSFTVGIPLILVLQVGLLYYLWR